MNKFSFIAAALLIGCSGSASNSPESQPTSQTTEPVPVEVNQAEPKVEPASSASSAPTVTARIASANERLGSSEAGKVVLQSIQAHGGLEKWFSAPVGFRFDYDSLVGGPKIDTFQVIDTQSSRARHVLVKDDQHAFDGTGAEFGWTGTQAWSTKLPETFQGNPRFWSLTPYYFVGMPFVLADPGVKLTQEADAELDGVNCSVVRVTFDAGVGDAPDDYYVVYFDKETHVLKGLRYIVTYRGFFKDGGHSPEKLMKYTDHKTFGGLVIATRYPTYKWDPAIAKVGDKVTDIALSGFTFVSDSASNFFDAPEGAQIQTEL